MMNSLKMSFNIQISNLASQKKKLFLKNLQTSGAEKGELSILEQGTKTQSLAKQEPVSDILKRENEIMELVYMGKSLEPEIEDANFKLKRASVDNPPKEGQESAEPEKKIK